VQFPVFGSQPGSQDAVSCLKRDADLSLLHTLVINCSLWSPQVLQNLGCGEGGGDNNHP